MNTANYRVAVVATPNHETVARYLPGNYRVIDHTETTTIIGGTDNLGWTLDGYVIPRLASGLYSCKEVGA